jgi:hypothetical protein
MSTEKTPPENRNPNQTPNHGKPEMGKQSPGQDQSPNRQQQAEQGRQGQQGDQLRNPQNPQNPQNQQRKPEQR